MGEPATLEPTMEEILASIRQIIAEEGREEDLEVDSVKGAQARNGDQIKNSPEPNLAHKPIDNGVGNVNMGQNYSEEGTGRANAAPHAQDYRQVDLDEGMIERRAMAGPSKAALGEEGSRSPRAIEDQEAERFRGALISRSTDQAVHASFERLKSSFNESLDDKTEKILRPMLQQWLDENLPTLVERLVREEIERVARGE